VTTDTSEKGLEGLVVAAMTGLREAPAREGSVSKPPTPYGGTGWLYGHAEDYDREYCADLMQLSAFLRKRVARV
jgi:type I restriction enzyme R subunit